MVLDGKSSQEYPVNAVKVKVPVKVSQGTILGPTIFLLYINDFPDDVICSIAIWGKKWLVDFNAGKTQLVSFDRSNNNGSIDVKMDESVLEEKSSFKMLVLTFFFKFDWGSYIISIAKTASKKIGAIIRFMEFLSPEVYADVWNTVVTCRLVPLVATCNC